MTTTLNSRTPARESGYEGIQYIGGRLTFVGTVTADTVKVKLGTLPAGSVLLAVNSRCITAATGGTPVWGIGTTSSAVGGSGDLVAAGITNTTGTTTQTLPSTTTAMPLAADTDVWLGTSGGATAAGDIVVFVMFAKPIA
jgi:hypothetical protein